MKKINYEKNTYYYKIIEIESIDFIFISTSDTDLETAISHLYCCRYNSIIQAILYFYKYVENYK